MAYRFEMPVAKPFTNDGAAEKEGDSKDNEIESMAHGRSDGVDEDIVDEDLQLRATCIYDQEEMRIYRMGE